VLDGCDILLARVVCFLVVVVIAGSDRDVPGAPLQPLLITLGAFPSTLGGGFKWCYTATAVGRFRIA
jgi:hypothetical protein